MARSVTDKADAPSNRSLPDVEVDGPAAPAPRRRDGHLAPFVLAAAGSVFARMYRSNASDQFSM
jgi:hypothetical protein